MQKSFEKEVAKVDLVVEFNSGEYTKQILVSD